MSKLDKIKQELAKLLLKYAVVKTDKGVLEYEGDEDLVAGMNVYIRDEQGERKDAENGEYVTEDGKTITVANGKVESIVDPIAEIDAEDIEPMEEPQEEPKKEEENVMLEDVNEAIENIRKEINELYKIVDSLLAKVGETRDEADARLKKLECSSQAKPAFEEFEQATKRTAKGDSKLDKFLMNYGK